MHIDMFVCEVDILESRGLHLSELAVTEDRVLLERCLLILRLLILVLLGKLQVEARLNIRIR